MITIKKACNNDAEVLAELGKRTFIETFASVNTEEDMQKYLKENFTIESVKAELCNSDSLFFIVYCDE